MPQSQPDIFSQIVSGLLNVVLVVIGGLIGYFVSKRERKEARADQRREKIYGPLHDELDNLELMISKTEDVATSNTVYDRVRAEHIRYMIPTKLRNQIIQLYEDMLPNYATTMQKLRDKYSALMYKSLFDNLGLLSTSSKFVATLAGLSYWLLQGKFPQNMLKEVEDAIFVMKEDTKNSFQYSNWQEYFAHWQGQMHEDAEFKKFEEMRKQIITRVQEVNKTIQNDLESEN